MRREDTGQHHLRWDRRVGLSMPSYVELECSSSLAFRSHQQQSTWDGVLAHSPTKLRLFCTTALLNSSKPSPNTRCLQQVTVQFLLNILHARKTSPAPELTPVSCIQVLPVSLVRVHPLYPTGNPTACPSPYLHTARYSCMKKYPQSRLYADNLRRSPRRFFPHGFTCSISHVQILCQVHSAPACSGTGHPVPWYLWNKRAEP